MWVWQKSRTRALYSIPARPSPTHCITPHPLQIQFIPFRLWPNPSRCYSVSGNLFVGVGETVIPSEPGRPAHTRWPHWTWANWVNLEEVEPSLPPLSANVWCTSVEREVGDWWWGKWKNQSGYLLSCSFTKNPLEMGGTHPPHLSKSYFCPPHYYCFIVLLLSCCHSPAERTSELINMLICSSESPSVISLPHAQSNKRATANGARALKTFFALGQATYRLPYLIGKRC